MENKMSVRIKILFYGMSIHPGNFWYVIIVGACIVAGFQNENMPWWIGLCSLVIWIPLYITTSYSVGKDNWENPAKEK